MFTRLLPAFFLLFPVFLQAAVLKGKITDAKGEPLPFASVYLKGTTKGTTSNAEGFYAFELPEGEHLLVCQYIGFQKQEIRMTLKAGENTKNFTLYPNEKTLKEVKIKAGENPALAIIRKTIKKRPYYNRQIDAYRANCYIKGNLKFKDALKAGALLKLLGEKDLDADSNQSIAEKGIFYLCESYNEIFVKRPQKLKVKVISSRVSGNKSVYGFSSPMFINLYDNNVQLGEELTPRGLISPIADAAMASYRYELLEAYMEDGKLINRIKVTPRRKFEPLFSGVIEIVENEWRLKAAELSTTKDYQLELIDSIQIRQLFVPVGDLLMVKDQSFYLDLTVLGFHIDGRFVNVFSDYDFRIDPKKVFDRFEQEYDSLALSRSKNYWDTIRPVPLEQDEARDYVKKDSLEQVKLQQKDTVKKPFKPRWSNLLLSGLSREQDSSGWSLGPLLDAGQMSWNTVEGMRAGYKASLWRQLGALRWKQDLLLRYGFSNQALQGVYRSRFFWGKTNRSTLEIFGGRNMFQYNNEDPVSEFWSSAYVLLAGRNYLKLYQAWHAGLQYRYKHVSGLQLFGKLDYQDRQPVGNSNLFSWNRVPLFTENYPTELIPGYEPRHQALRLAVGGSYQPGRKYIRYPDRIVATESNLPTFRGELQFGLPLAGSDIDYARYRVSMDDAMDLNLWGNLSYRVGVGGFLYNNASFTADYTHFNGGQMLPASTYLNSFQLSPYYQNSNTRAFFAFGHAEHHFKGLLTNKIPLFRRLKWHLVAASNAYYVNRTNNYIEVSAGLENIGIRQFKILRVDGVAGYTNFSRPVYGIRLGLAGIFGGGDSEGGGGGGGTSIQISL